MCILNEQFSRINLLTSVKKTSGNGITSNVCILFQQMKDWFISIYIQMVGTRPQVFWGGGEGIGHAILYVLRNLASHIRRHIQQYNIYNHPSVTICAAITKIPHVLYERSLLKTRKWWMIFIHDLYTMNVMGMGENPEINEKQGKKSPFGCPPIPPSLRSEADCFPGWKEPKTSRAYPRWDRDPNLQG